MLSCTARAHANRTLFQHQPRPRYGVCASHGWLSINRHLSTDTAKIPSRRVFCSRQTATLLLSASAVFISGALVINQLDVSSFRPQYRRNLCDDGSATNSTVSSVMTRVQEWGTSPKELEEREAGLQKKLAEISRQEQTQQRLESESAAGTVETSQDESNPWLLFTEKLSLMTDSITSVNLSKLPQLDFIPQWTLGLPDWLTKLQRELNMEPGSLADEIWQEAQDPIMNPELQWEATVRISDDLCDEEKAYLQNRRLYTKRALAKYLDIEEQDINEEDVPIIAITGSGGGLRAMVAGAGSMEAATKAGLFDCTTYMVGVSGSCWLMTTYFTIGGRDFSRCIEHMKDRLGVHIAYPPAALDLVNCAPTNKYLLRGIVERLKQGYASFGLVDIYGLLLAARLLVPSNELVVKDEEMKLSNQVKYVATGEQPLPIYTAVRHEIPGLGGEGEAQTERYGPDVSNEEAKERAKKESWFEWAEWTPFEFFIEEAGAGIPTWSLGRKFENGRNVSRETEMKLPILLGLWGSAFCATLSHYYKEARPHFSTVFFFKIMDNFIQERDDDLIKVHPIDPAAIPNYLLGLRDRLPASCAESMHKTPEIKLMDAGMSNNLATYPLFRPGRNVDIIVCFDSSAEIQTANWLSMTEGYTKQRGLKGWPVGIGWPRENDPHPEEELSTSQASSPDDALDKLEQAQADDPIVGKDKKRAGGLGTLTIWVGTKEEKTIDHEPPPSRAVEDEWELMRPDAGFTVAYFPLIPNNKVPGVDPETSHYLSTWNFEYTPADIEATVRLATENFNEGEAKMKRTVRAVYERKKKLRVQRQDLFSSRNYDMLSSAS